MSTWEKTRFQSRLNQDKLSQNTKAGSCSGRKIKELFSNHYKYGIRTSTSKSQAGITPIKDAVPKAKRSQHLWKQQSDFLTRRLYVEDTVATQTQILHYKLLSCLKSTYNSFLLLTILE